MRAKSLKKRKGNLGNLFLRELFRGKLTSMNQNCLTCPECGTPVKGRADKKFCDTFCRSAFHNRRRKKDVAVFDLIEGILRHNHSILKSFQANLPRAREKRVDKSKLIRSGFDFTYYTHMKRSEQTMELYWFDVGLKVEDSGNSGYLIID